MLRQNSLYKKQRCYATACDAAFSGDGSHRTHVVIIWDLGYAAAGSVSGSASGTRRSAAARDMVNCLKTCKLVSKSLVSYYTRYGLDGPGIESW